MSRSTHRINRLLPLACGLALALAQPVYAQTDHPDQRVGTVLADGVGYVSAARLSHQADASDNGRLLLVFEREGMDGIPLYESRDDGEHWTFLRNVTDQQHGSDKRCQLRWQPHLSEMTRDSGTLKAGTLLLAANAGGNDANGRVAAQDLQLYASTDGGQQWRYRGSIVKGGGKPDDNDNKGVWEPNMHILDDGRMVAYYSSEQHKAEGYNQLLAHKVSSDGGRSWGAEVIDVAIAGGVARPGMAIVDRLPDGRYVMSYENIDGPLNGQVHVKFSRDGLDWGDPGDPGTPVQTAAGAYPSASPIVRWFPQGGADGVLVIAAERAAGGGDPGGRKLYWNNNLGQGPWWEMPAPVQKLTGNIHAGWTQELLFRKDGSLLHITSSSRDGEPKASRNEILYAHAPVAFDRYEAEDAARSSAVMIGGTKLSNGGKARVAAAPGGRLTFDIHVERAASHVLTLRYADVGLPVQPRLIVNGSALAMAAGTPVDDGWYEARFTAPLRAGDNTIVVAGGAHVMDVDYLQLGSPAQ
jgi:hypothetical protein